ncbi:hypothetical protein EZV62_025801 [Acer yangbiense]|uniref:COP1-interacting protein 7 n=1 Tax=Acer yangbiense TaxID=1000413 RepID=A0A5C7H0W3_9ROSI|nr:hypothetical protein EZV62_025801 [Acer yangbiense]
MASGLDAVAPLDYATIQIFPSQNRYEAFVFSNNKVEKLAVGPLEQLLPNILGLNTLSAEGSDANFKLQLPGNSNGAAWFTKSTLNRFLTIVGSPDLVNTAKAIEGEMSQLEEARKFHLSLYTQPDSQVASSDTSKNELLRAMDLRISALKGELAVAFSQVAGATCSYNELANITEFARHFGAADLNNSLCKVLELNQKSQSVDKSSVSHVPRNDSASKKDGNTQIPKASNQETPVKYGVSPAKAAQLERQSSMESEESSDSSEENQASVERSRPLIRSASPRRSASPMRRVQIGRTGSRRAAALTIKSLNLFPARERTLSFRDAAGDSSEEEGSQQQTFKKTDINVQRMSVQDKISLFESKQRDQTTDSQKKNSLANALNNGNKSVLRRWSAGMGEYSAQSEPQISSEDSGPVISNDVVEIEDLKSSVEVKSDSNLVSGGQTPAETAEVDVQLDRWEEQTSDRLDVQADTDVAQREEINERLTASAEWSRQKEMELNQMLKKMMETQPTKSKKPSTSKKQNPSSEQRGGFYDHYKEKRDEKLRGETARKRAEKDAQFKAMKQILDERKAEMASKNVNDVGKKLPQQKPQKSLKDSPQSANTRKETPKPTVTKKVQSKTSPLPAARKSWPSTPSPRATGASPAKTPGGISSAGTTPTRRKPQSATSVPRPNPKTERPRQPVRNVKESKINTERSLKGINEKKQQTVARSGKTTKAKVTTASADSSDVVPAKPSFYNKVTRKGSVVPLESKPFLRKGSGISSGVGPAINKTKLSPQAEESSRKSGNLVEAQETEVVANTSSVVREDQEQDSVSLGNCDASIEMETTLNDQQTCSGMEEDFNQPAADNDDGLKNMVESSLKVQTEEESIISPSAWVEIEEENQDLPNPCHDGSISQTASPVNVVVPIGMSSPRVRHSLSQMLQEESSEPDTNEWGNAENPPSMIYQKDAPKGLKRLLKFARKSKGDASSTGWSSPSVFSEGEDDTEESKAASRRNSDNLLRKAALHAKNYGMQKTSVSDDYLKSVDAHLLTDQSSFSRFDAKNSHKLKSHISAAAPTTKGRILLYILTASFLFLLMLILWMSIDSNIFYYVCVSASSTEIINIRLFPHPDIGLNQQFPDFPHHFLNLYSFRVSEVRSHCYASACGTEEMNILMIQQVASKSMPVKDRKLQRIWKLNSCRGNTILLPDFGSGPP